MPEPAAYRPFVKSAPRLLCGSPTINLAFFESVLGVRMNDYWDRLKKTAEGAKILANWIAQGAEPVHGDCAERRAKIFAHCVQNHPGSLSDLFTKQASELIRRQIRAQWNLN